MSTTEWGVPTEGQTSRRSSLMQPSVWRQSNPPEEIRAGAICSHSDVPGYCTIDAVTASGSRRFEAIELSGGDLQSEVVACPVQSAVGEFLSCLALWGDFSRNLKRIAEPAPSAEEQIEQSLTAEDILQKLADATTVHDERRRWIIEAEVVRFSGQCKRCTVRKESHWRQTLAMPTILCCDKR